MVGGDDFVDNTGSSFTKLVGAKLEFKFSNLLRIFCVSMTIQFLFSYGERQAVNKYMICEVSYK